MDRFLTPLATKKRFWEIPVGFLSAFLGVISVEVAFENPPVDESLVAWLFAYIATTALMLLPLYGIVRRRLRQRAAKAVAKRLAELREPAIPLLESDRVFGIKNANDKISDLVKRGYLRRVEIEDGEYLRVDLPAEAKPEPREEPTEAPADVIARIRRLNDEIADEAVSERIDRIERVTKSILRTIEARPERADDARRFMDYYLPMTMKLLESYRLMEKQSYQGRNIQASRRRIEHVLDEIVTAVETQQDKLFGAEALNVEADITVLETMLAADGLIGDRNLPREGV